MRPPWWAAYAARIRSAPAIEVTWSSTASGDLLDPGAAAQLGDEHTHAFIALLVHETRGDRGTRLRERHGAGGAPLHRLDQVKTAAALHDVAHLPRLQPQGGALDGWQRAAAGPHEADVPATPGFGSIGVQARHFGKVLA